jgi:hypothetical protein
MVAMNSIPQHDVAKGKGHKEFLRASPTTELNCVAKNPSPGTPSGAFPIPIASAISASFGCMLNLTGRIMYALYFKN